MSESDCNDSEMTLTELAEKYSPLLNSMKSRFANCLGEGEGPEDLSQIILIGLSRAKDTFSPDKNVAFGSYAKYCIRNACISHYRFVNAKKRKAVALRPKEKTPAPDLSSIDLSQLTSLEKSVITMKTEGEKSGYIALRLGVDEKTVYNAMYRGRQKLRRQLLKPRS